jgi:hypothetical protein
MLVEVDTDGVSFSAPRGLGKDAERPIVATAATFPPYEMYRRREGFARYAPSVPSLVQRREVIRDAAGV